MDHTSNHHNHSMSPGGIVECQCFKYGRSSSPSHSLQDPADLLNCRLNKCSSSLPQYARGKMIALEATMRRRDHTGSATNSPAGTQQPAAVLLNSDDPVLTDPKAGGEQCLANPPDAEGK